MLQGMSVSTGYRYEPGKHCLGLLAESGSVLVRLTRAGAVFANNPSLVGVTKVKSHYPLLKIADVRVLSLGTGDFPASIDLQGDDNADWGIRQWAPHLLDMLIDASSVNVDMNLRLLMNANYHRLDPVLPWRINLDNTDAMDELVKAADEADVEVSELLSGRGGGEGSGSCRLGLGGRVYDCVGVRAGVQLQDAPLPAGNHSTLLADTQGDRDGQAFSAVAC